MHLPEVADELLIVKAGQDIPLRESPEFTIVILAHQETERRRHMNMETALKEAMTIDGAVGVCIVDWESGMSLGALGGGKYLDLDVAAAGNTEVIRAKMRTMESLRLDDNIEDILITLNKQYHLIRLLKNSRNEQGLFLYLVLDRAKANLALARHNLRATETALTIGGCQGQRNEQIGKPRITSWASKEPARCRDDKKAAAGGGI